MSTQNLIVASIADPGMAGKVVENLQKAGFDMKKWSVVAHDDGMASGSALGVEHFTGLSDLGTARFSCIPRERIPDYQSELQGNRLLLVAQGTSEEVDVAKHVIDKTHPCEWDAKVGAAVFYGCTE